VKDIALQAAAEAKDHKLHTLREYLQNYLLFLMQKLGMSVSLYFVGGTALRFLYHIRRYSEDMDFSAGKDWVPSDLSGFAKKISNHLEKAGYFFTLKVKQVRTVRKIQIGFIGLLYEAGLTHRKEQKLNIHIDVDSNPPGGWNGQKTIVDLHLPVVLQHYDLPSLFAGKLHALLMRSYTKGRDVYDLFWYRTKHRGLLPNFLLLNNALHQSQGDFVKITAENWLEILARRIRALDWKSVENDVLPFLEFRDDLLTFKQENLLMLLEG
jgi:predicted nucleotidyltransferase component of viral defense system